MEITKERGSMTKLKRDVPCFSMPSDIQQKMEQALPKGLFIQDATYCEEKENGVSHHKDYLSGEIRWDDEPVDTDGSYMDTRFSSDHGPGHNHEIHNPRKNRLYDRFGSEVNAIDLGRMLGKLQDIKFMQIRSDDHGRVFVAEIKKGVSLYVLPDRAATASSGEVTFAEIQGSPGNVIKYIKVKIRGTGDSESVRARDNDDKLRRSDLSPIPIKEHSISFTGDGDGKSMVSFEVKFFGEPRTYTTSEIEVMREIGFLEKFKREYIE